MPRLCVDLHEVGRAFDARSPADVGIAIEAAQQLRAGDSFGVKGCDARRNLRLCVGPVATVEKPVEGVAVSP
jgi:hypothetical protein